MDTIPQKQCRKCQQYFDLVPANFFRWKHSPDGYSNYCKRCDYEFKYNAGNKEKCNARSIDWAKRNPDKVRIIKKRARKPDPVGNKIRGKRFRQRHPDKIKQGTAKRRANLRNAEGEHTAADLELQYKSQKGLCWWCGRELGDKWHEDHLIPLNRGGTNWPNNIVCSCARCNTSRQDKLPHEWTDRLL